MDSHYRNAVKAMLAASVMLAPVASAAEDIRVAGTSEAALPSQHHVQCREPGINTRLKEEALIDCGAPATGFAASAISYERVENDELPALERFYKGLSARFRIAFAEQ